MRMSVKAKKIAISGMLAAISAVLVTLGALIETSTLFLIAAASFGVGITIREWGLRFGAGYWVASTLVNVLVAPNKFYCITYACMGLYILLSECWWQKIADSGYMTYRMTALWLGKYAIFNLMFVPSVLFLQEIFIPGKLESLGVMVIILLGQVALLVYDNAYRYFQTVIWGRIRINIVLKGKM